MKLEGYDQLRKTGFHVKELLWSQSTKNVLRGMHFQTPPRDGSKLIWVTQGTILDVALDLRSGSPTYLQWMSLQMKPTTDALFLAPGIAHGFLVLHGVATVNYAQSFTFSARHDRGIKWNSFGMSWPCANPVLSRRDTELPDLAEFETPFSFEV